MSITGAELAKHYSENAGLAAEVIALYRDLVERVRAAQETVRGQLRTDLAELAEAYLPDLTPAALADVAQRAGFKKLQQRDPLQAMAREEDTLKRRLAVIQGLDEYRRRQWLVGANGELTRALDEATSMLQPWEEACARFEEHDHFLALVELGYDTPNYEVSFLEPRYWTFWAAGDRICRELELGDFGDDVLPAWREVEAERARWRAQVAAAQAKVDAVHELIREHDQAMARIPRLPEIYLHASRQALASFLGLADPKLLAQWNEGHATPDRAVTMGLRRVAGLRAKLEVLTELIERGLLPFVANLEERLAKFRRKREKFRRPKHVRARHPDSFADPGFAQKEPKYRQRAAQVALLVDRLLAYDVYEDFDLERNEPELWFRHMTGKAPPRLIPGLRSWYDRNPQHRPVRDRRDRDDRAARAAAATSSADDLGYLS